MSDGGAQPEEGRLVSACNVAANQHEYKFVFISNMSFFFNTRSVLSVGSKQYSASIAFTLALFSHVVNHVNIRLQAELEETESQVPPLPTDATGERGNLCL